VEFHDLRNAVGPLPRSSPPLNAGWASARCRAAARRLAGKEQCTPVLVKVRPGLTTSNLLRSRLIRNIESGRETESLSWWIPLIAFCQTLETCRTTSITSMLRSSKCWRSGSGPPAERGRDREDEILGARSRTRLGSLAPDAVQTLMMLLGYGSFVACNTRMTGVCPIGLTSGTTSQAIRGGVRCRRNAAHRSQQM
jgi:hypothetical protein